MAANNWDNSTADGLANTAANWSLGNVPTGTDVATFLDAVSSTNCLFDVSISCAGIDVKVTYSGDVDMATFNLTTSSDMTFDGSGIFDCGTGTLTCSGNFDNKDQTTWDGGSSTLVMKGTGKTIVSDVSNDVFNLTIFAGATITLDASTNSLLDVARDFDLQAGATLTLNVQLRLRLAGAEHTVTLSGDILGSDQLQIVRASITHDGGSISSGTTVLLKRTSSLLMTGASQTFGGTWLCEADSGATPVLTFGAGTFTFSGDTTFNGDTGNVYTVDLETNDPNLVFDGDVTLNETGGANKLAWTKSSTGTVTFGGTTDFTDNTAAIQNLGDVEVDGTSLTLSSNMDCADFTLTTGTVDIDANDLDLTGNYLQAQGTTIQDTTGGGTVIIAGTLDINGISGTPCVWNGPDVNLTGTGDADWTTITNSATVVVSDIDATFNCTDGTGNGAGWDFGGAPAAGTANPLVMGATNLMAGKLAV